MLVEEIIFFLLTFIWPTKIFGKVQSLVLEGDQTRQTLGQITINPPSIRARHARHLIPGHAYYDYAGGGVIHLAGGVAALVWGLGWLP